MKLYWKGMGYDKLVQPVVTGIFDYDGNEYTEVVVGTQTWLVEPCRTSTFTDGTSIYYENTDTAQTTNPAYRVLLNDSSNKDKFGYLYNIKSRDAGKDFVTGYHIPTKAEVTTLKDYTSTSYKIRATGTTYWDDSNGTDDYGFNLRGGGYASPGFNNYKGSGSDVYFDGWTSDVGIWIVRDTENSISFYDAGTSTSTYMAIRLIKD